MKKFFHYAGSVGVGLINGLLGAGGGLLAVPLLEKEGLPAKKSHASSIAIILPLSIFSAVLYYVSSRVKIMDAVPYMPFGIVGAIIGAWLLPRIKSTLLKRIFACFLIWAGIRLLIK